MTSPLIARLEKHPTWQLLAGVGVLIVITTELIVAAIGMLLYGGIRQDFLLTGLMACVLVVPTAMMLIHRLRQSLAEIAASRTVNNLELASIAAQCIFWELDLRSGQFDYDNEKISLLGLEFSQPPHNIETWIKLVHPDEQAVFMEKFHAALLPDSAGFDMEYRFSPIPDSLQQSGAWQQEDGWSHSGSWGWLHTKGKVIRRDAEGQPLRAAGITMNVSVRKTAELQSLNAQKRFELIFNSNPDAMVISRLPEGIITHVNDAFVIGSGYSRPEAIGKTTVELGLWSHQERQKMADAIGRDGACRAMEFDFTMKNGEQRTGSFSAVVCRLEGLPHLVSTVHDITERKQAALKLQRNESLLRTTLDSTEEGILMVASDGSLLSSNRRFAELWQLPPEIADSEQSERRLKHVMKQLADPQAFVERVRQLNAGNEESHDTLHFRDGRVFARYTRALTLDGERGRIWCFRDITQQKHNEQALLASEQKMRTILDNVDAYIYLKDAAGRYLFANRLVRELWQAEMPDIIGFGDEKFFDAATTANIRANDQRVLQHGETLRAEETNTVLETGKNATFLSTKLPLRDETGQIYALCGISTDITARKLAELQLADREAQLRTLVEAVPDFVQLKDGAGRWLIANTVCLRFFGLEGLAWQNLTEAEIVRRHPQLAISLPSSHMEDEEAWQAGELFRFEKSIADANGEAHHFDVLKAPLFDEQGGRKALVIVARDITEKKRSEEQIWRQANFDALTSLPNRRMFHDRLMQDLKKAHRTGLKLALLFLDLDHFKEVNDTLGHDAGDALLIDAAYRIVACVRDSDTVARLGGDEFTIILTGLEDSSVVERITTDIIHSLGQPVHLGNDTAYVSASIGVTIYPDDGLDLDTLLKNADQAMFAAKQAGRNRHSYFTNALQEAAQHRQQLIGDLRIALQQGQFQLYYQPIVELATGKVGKAECLLRWLHPVRGFVSPEEFIPLAEDSGLILEIGEWVFAQAARQLSHCRTYCGQGFQLSVNVSPVQFHNTLKQKQWMDILASHQLQGDNIVVEITEGLLLETSDKVIEQLLAFRDAGIQVAIDDFGTGYSTLSYLNKLDIDYLKIDQSFIRNLSTDSSEMALVEGIIVMAHKLGLKVIAEGVESAEQNALLQAVNCDYVQGNHYSRPMPADQLEAWLQARRATLG